VCADPGHIGHLGQITRLLLQHGKQGGVVKDNVGRHAFGFSEPAPLSPQGGPGVWVGRYVGCLDALAGWALAGWQRVLTQLDVCLSPQYRATGISELQSPVPVRVGGEQAVGQKLTDNGLP